MTQELEEEYRYMVDELESIQTLMDDIKIDCDDLPYEELDQEELKLKALGERLSEMKNYLSVEMSLLDMDEKLDNH